MREIYMVLIGPSGSVFVKTLEYFTSLGGFKETWGKKWNPLVVESLEDARKLGCNLPGARPYAQQAK